MKRWTIWVMLWCLAVFFAAPSLGLAAPAEEATATARESVRVLQEFSAVPEQGIPPTLLRQAQAIAVIPGTVKMGFILAGRFGRGLMQVRSEDGAWGLPFMVSIVGGSVGWQLGMQATDVVLVFKGRRGIEAIRDGKFTLGADASVAAGPVGRHFEAATDAQLKAAVYSYSRNKGVFAGLALEGTVMQPDRTSTEALYGRPADLVPQADTVIPPAVKEFRRLVETMAAPR